MAPGAESRWGGRDGQVTLEEEEQPEPPWTVGQHLDRQIEALRRHVTGLSAPRSPAEQQWHGSPGAAGPEGQARVDVAPGPVQEDGAASSPSRAAPDDDSGRRGAQPGSGAVLRADGVSIGEHLDFRLGDMEAAIESQASELAALQALQARQRHELAALGEALGEGCSGELLHLPECAAAASGADRDRLAAQLGALRAAHERHVRDLADLRAAAHDLREAEAQRGAEHGTLRVRLDYVEQALERRALAGDPAGPAPQAWRFGPASAGLDPTRSFSSAASPLSGSHGPRDLAHASLSPAGASGLLDPACAPGAQGACQEGLSSFCIGEPLPDVRAALESHCASMDAIGSWLDANARAAEEAHAKADVALQRLEACERRACHGRAEPPASPGRGLADRAAQEVQESLLREKVDYVESLVGELSRRQADELRALRAESRAAAAELRAQCGRLEGLFAGRGEEEASAVGLVVQLEGRLRDGLEEQRAAVAELAEAVRASDGRQAALEGRLKQAEKDAEAIAEQAGEVLARDAMHTSLARRLDEFEAATSEALAATNHALAQLVGRGAEGRAALEAHSGAIQALRAAQEEALAVEPRPRAGAEAAERQAKELAALRERVAGLEGVLGVRGAWPLEGLPPPRAAARPPAFEGAECAARVAEELRAASAHLESLRGRGAGGGAGAGGPQVDAPGPSAPAPPLE